MLLLHSFQKDIAIARETTRAIATDERLPLQGGSCSPYLASPCLGKASSLGALWARAMTTVPVRTFPVPVCEHTGREEIWTILKND
jgi:hypothetical protein